jgi:hypothetical protein
LQAALSNDVRVSPPKDSERRAAATPNGRGAAPGDAPGVLSKLPRTRPQRSSARRTAARDATAAAEAARTSSARSNGHTPRRASTTSVRAPKPAGAKRRPAKRTAAPMEPAPRQGFECEGERSSGSVHPPGGAELVASAAEIVSELAKAGLSTGERLLKDFLSRLPLS